MIQFETIAKGVGLLTMNRPELRNVFNWQAMEAYEQRLANREVPEGTSLEAALALARDIASRDPQSVRSAKQLLDAGQRLPLPEAQRAKGALFPDLWAAPAHLVEASTWFVSRKKPSTKMRLASVE